MWVAYLKYLSTSQVHLCYEWLCLVCIELKVGGLLLTQMEEEPMVKQTEQPTALDIEKSVLF